MLGGSYLPNKNSKILDNLNIDDKKDPCDELIDELKNIFIKGGKSTVNLAIIDKESTLINFDERQKIKFKKSIKVIYTLSKSELNTLFKKEV